MLGRKKFTHCSEVKVIKVPHLEGLRVSDILQFARRSFNMNQFLPEFSYDKEPNRDWLCNLVNTAVEEKFKNFISEQRKKREQKIIAHKNLAVDALPEFVNIFKKSTEVSTSRGKSYFVTRNYVPVLSKKRQVEFEKKQKQEEERHNEFTDKIKSIEEEIQKYESKEGENDHNREILSKLFEMQVIDGDGNLIKSEEKSS
uniref:Uncharacterized protein n=1 Tax=Euplotes harpa TaxID=151035 RepID=A0A7S3JAA4_9SPIT|mmetsp:Transcript_29014/g.33142  ORF Transcript_29014/g.33142 Transcript_29014/m.33142 type:complete len:200 (+) Transcript_29014:182-781(+)